MVDLDGARLAQREVELLCAQGVDRDVRWEI